MLVLLTVLPALLQLPVCAVAPVSSLSCVGYIVALALQPRSMSGTEVVERALTTSVVVLLILGMQWRKERVEREEWRTFAELQARWRRE